MATDELSGLVGWKLLKAIRGRKEAPHQNEGVAVITRRDSDGTTYVRLPGSTIDTPVNGTNVVSAGKGDEVAYAINNGRLSITGSTSDPAASSAKLQYVGERADSAFENASRAYNAAAAAEIDAGRARIAADSAETDAARAASSASAAQTSASQASTAAQTAQSSASTAATAAQGAQQSASSAASSAASAASDASAARADATRASRAADSALVQASIVEDVAGTLAWIQEHGTFTATADTSVQEGTVYFERDPISLDYVPIASPPEGANPHALGWYVLDVTDSQSDYIMAHLAVTSAGLWVLPSGSDSQGGPRYSSGYKLLVASDGMRLYDDSGQLVAEYGESIDFSSSRPQHIGGENAYISYYDSDDDGVPDAIYIGGSRITFGSKTLSQFEQAINDATAARRYAEDVPIVTLSSTNGTTFKRNAGVSTTIIATIFTPGGRIDDATELHRRFGAGAYLEWGWRDVVTDSDHILISTDQRIILDGFGLVVSPSDIDSQAVITCSLNY